MLWVTFSILVSGTYFRPMLGVPHTILIQYGWIFLFVVVLGLCGDKIDILWDMFVGKWELHIQGPA